MRSDITVPSFLLLMGMAISGQVLVAHQGNRAPAAAQKSLELHLQNLTLDSASRLQKLDKVFLRATFNKETIMEFGKNESWTLNGGETRRLDLKIDVKPEWLANDSLEFKLEIVQAGVIESTVVRCSTVSKSVSTYNRAYQCNIPGETTPLLTYRLAGKGDPIPGTPEIRTASGRR